MILAGAIGGTKTHLALFRPQTGRLGSIAEETFPSGKFPDLAARPVYEKEKVPVVTPADRVRHVVQSSFCGRRVVIFSEGSAAGEEQILDEVRAIRDGGGFGSIIGRNTFQRKKAEALRLLDQIMRIYGGQATWSTGPRPA